MADQQTKHVMSQDVIKGFQKTTTNEIDFLVRFLMDANQKQSARESFKEQLAMLDIQHGHSILDIGCGIGDRAFEMAKKVGSSGKVVGTDLSELMITAARGLYENSDLPLSFHIAEASKQPFASESFDIIRIERVLLYVPDVGKAFQEFDRLLKPGGKLLVFDLDFDALSIGHINKSLTRKIVQFLSDSFPNGKVATELRGHLESSSFRRVKMKPMSYLPDGIEFFKRVISGTIESGVMKGVFDETEIAQWWTHLENEDRKGIFWACFNGLLIMGEKKA